MKLFIATLAGLVAGLFIGGVAGHGLALGQQTGGTVSEVAPPLYLETPAYMIVLGDVSDREAFMSGYAAKLPPVYDKYGGQYIAIGRGVEVLEGDYAPESFVVARWPSVEAARTFWNSPEYDQLRRARLDGEWGDFDVLLVEGLPGERAD